MKMKKKEKKLRGNETFDLNEGSCKLLVCQANCLSEPLADMLSTTHSENTRTKKSYTIAHQCTCIDDPRSVPFS